MGKNAEERELSIEQVDRAEPTRVKVPDGNMFH